MSRRSIAFASICLAAAMLAACAKQETAPVAATGSDGLEARSTSWPGRATSEGIVASASWPFQVNTLIANRQPVASTTRPADDSH